MSMFSSQGDSPKKMGSIFKQPNLEKYVADYGQDKHFKPLMKQYEQNNLKVLKNKFHLNKQLEIQKTMNELKQMQDKSKKYLEKVKEM